MAFSLRCCHRALFEDLALSSKRASIRAFTTTSYRPQFQSSQTPTGLPSEIVSDDSPLRRRDDRTENKDLPPWLRIVPASSSYFTGSAEFFDSWLEVQDILRKHQTLPTVIPSEAPRVSWKTLPQFRGDHSGSTVTPSKYKKILDLLTRLNRIDPNLKPDDVVEIIDRYRRPGSELVVPPKPKVIDHLGRAYALGRRKESSARVYLVEGDGGVIINGKPLQQKFARLHDRESVIWPLMATNRVDKYNVWAIVQGGGTTGQAEALTLGVAKALMVHEPLLKPVLRRAGVITRDPRTVERKKHGKLKARKMPAWVKR